MCAIAGEGQARHALAVRRVEAAQALPGAHAPDLQGGCGRGAALGRRGFHAPVAVPQLPALQPTHLSLACPPTPSTPHLDAPVLVARGQQLAVAGEGQGQHS